MMIRHYRKISPLKLFLLAVFSLAVVYLVSHANTMNQWYAFKIEAARKAKAAQEGIREEKLKRGLSINDSDDPNASGLIGLKDSAITTDKGFLDMKIMATNPNLAAVIVQMMREAKIRPGDTVAVGYTGSFPGANIAVLSAIEAVGLNAVIISSVGSSNWGANEPEFTWLDMERFLFGKGIFKHRSVAASLGGKQDIAEGLSEEARGLMAAAVRRSDVELIDELSLPANVYKRLQIYDANTQKKGKRIKMYINVGGGSANLGSGINYMRVPSGLTTRLSSERIGGNGVLFKMADKGIPVIHILKMRELTYQYGLPIRPVRPVVGEGRVFVEARYNSSVALIGLGVLLFVLAATLSVDFVSFSKRKAITHEGSSYVVR